MSSLKLPQTHFDELLLNHSCHGRFKTIFAQMLYLKVLPSPFKKLLLLHQIPVIMPHNRQVMTSAGLVINEYVDCRIYISSIYVLGRRTQRPQLMHLKGSFFPCTFLMPLPWWINSVCGGGGAFLFHLVFSSLYCVGLLFFSTKSLNLGCQDHQTALVQTAKVLLYKTNRQKYLV